MHRLLILIALGLAGCGHLGSPPASSTIARLPTRPTEARLPADSRAHDVVMFALGLVDTGYRFGGKNPDAGLDCSGMVNYVFSKAADLQLGGSAADLARLGQPVGTPGLRPGDLVFFNTRNRPRSHVGIYIGDGRFVHAPNSNGKVRTESLTHGWFATRFEEARTYFD
ncbi:MAG: C40 family peptidase [Gammaproteobacteria bacterium]|nr:NlpC/P60 family protein [Rhodocyclaceae bacterium]MBU3907992.1 C40 family peptidase [Gammaproteobacteria bacterium]MBU3990626.1 C40 family peptidase [Gammaproteobacteria bacterium]MBU4006077.1 C40 family peptidase [Gammaproteobacteria bacterium]MBU4022078.1 C40 family peptidase [Gammaproteobacteria bacterium]